MAEWRNDEDKGHYLGMPELINDNVIRKNEKRIATEQLFRLYDEIAEWRNDKDKGHMYLGRDIVWSGLSLNTKDKLFLERHWNDRQQIRSYISSRPFNYLLTLLGYAHYIHELVLSDKLPG
jgi:hypothetical protein